MSQEVEPDLPSVVGHYDLLLQVFANLVGNSLKFTEAGGRVIIRAYLLDEEPKFYSKEAEEIEKGGWIISPPPPRPFDEQIESEIPPQAQYVRIEVSDTGSGIAPEDQEAVFTRFYRVENRVHTLEGTGLGLSIVRNIMEKHHSQVHLISELGIGTTFWFDLAVYQDISGFRSHTQEIASGGESLPIKNN